MAQTVFAHRRRYRNVGDLACTPGHYFDLGHHSYVDFADELPACDLAVLGGGQVFQDCVETAIYRSRKARAVAIWGVGISPKDRRSLDFDILCGRASLISSRNVDVAGCEYVPCVSGMSPLFDAAPAPRHEVVLFYHAKKSADLVRDPAIPSLGNDIASMEEAIDFLASGATVVTNSYHGTYWAMCLGRRVLCVPFGPKFLHFPENPVQAGPADWVQALDRAEKREEMLGLARERNLAFCEKVRALL